MKSNERGSDFPQNECGADFVTRNRFRIVEIYLNVILKFGLVIHSVDFL